MMKKFTRLKHSYFTTDSNTFKANRIIFTQSTICNEQQRTNNPLTVGGFGDSLKSTTKTIVGNRTRQTCDFFVSQISQSLGGFTAPENYSKFAIRAICRNKAEYIRTNKAIRTMAEVEPLSHPFSDKPFSLTKTIETMIYLFQCVNRYAPTYQEQIVLIHADNAENARFKLTAQFALLSTVAQFPDRLARQAVQKYARLQQRLAGAFTLSAEQGACYA